MGMPDTGDYAFMEQNVYSGKDIENWLEVGNINILWKAMSTALHKNLLNSYSSILWTTNKN